MLWIRLSYKLTRKIFWFQSNFTPSCPSKKKKGAGDCKRCWDCRGWALLAPRPTWGLEGEQVQPWRRWTPRAGSAGVRGEAGSILPWKPASLATLPGCVPSVHLQAPGASRLFPGQGRWGQHGGPGTCLAGL